MYSARQLSAQVTASGAACKIANVFAGLAENACVVWAEWTRERREHIDKGRVLLGWGTGMGLTHASVVRKQAVAYLG